MDNRDQIEEIKSKLDISTVILQYVPGLKRSGRNYFGLCPFHKEKTPSFSVNPELGLFKCFGCGEGGDVIKFLEKIEGLDFPNALELAAQKAGVTLKKTYSPEAQKFKEERDKLLEANKLAAKFFNYVLLKHEAGKLGREYVQKRKIPDEQVKEFVLGYAPRSFNALKDFLNKKGYADKDLVKWGLLVEKNNKIYDKFRGRLMFTIFNHQGEVIGFTGRAIFEDEQGPKYLNSPETLVYKKSQVLFGLYQAKETIRKEGFVILVEGNVDPITSHGVGIKNIVAPMGTALTPEQLRLIKRYCDKVYFSFDNDAAGQKALVRSFELAESAGLESYVVEIKGYKSADELIFAGGDWPHAVANPKEIVAYLISYSATKYDLSNARYKASYVKEVLGYISKIQSDVASEEYLKQVSYIADVSMDILTQELQTLKNGPKTTAAPSYNTKTEVPDGLTSKAMGIGDLLVEFIAVLTNNKNYTVDQKLITETLGTGTSMELYKYVIGEKSTLDIAKYQHIIEDLKMRADVGIDDEKVFQHILKTLSERIIRKKTQMEMRKIVRSAGEVDDVALEKLNEQSKFLKN